MVWKAVVPDGCLANEVIGADDLLIAWLEALDVLTDDHLLAGLLDFLFGFGFILGYYLELS